MPFFSFKKYPPLLSIAYIATDLLFFGTFISGHVFILGESFVPLEISHRSLFASLAIMAALTFRDVAVLHMGIPHTFRDVTVTVHETVTWWARLMMENSHVVFGVSLYTLRHHIVFCSRLESIERGDRNWRWNMFFVWWFYYIQIHVLYGSIIYRHISDAFQSDNKESQALW